MTDGTRIAIISAAIFILWLVFQIFKSAKQMEHQKLMEDASKKAEEQRTANRLSHFEQVAAKSIERKEKATALMNSIHNFHDESRSVIANLPQLDITIFSQLITNNKESIQKQNATHVHNLVRIKNYITSEFSRIKSAKINWSKSRVGLHYCIPTKMIEKAAGRDEEKRVCRKVRINRIGGTNQPNEYQFVEVSVDDMKKEFNFIVKRYQHLNRVMVLSCIMIESLISNDMITFYLLYEKFDKFGVFDSDWEKRVENKLLKIENKLDEISFGIQSLIYAIEELEGNLISEISKLEQNISSEIKALDANISNHMRSIDSQFLYSNVLLTYNTYQLYKLRKGK